MTDGPPGSTVGIKVLTLCTGNAARSVIAGAIMRADGAAVDVVTAGTHVVEHQPMSVRTRRALVELGLPVPAHRSHQVTDTDVAGSDLVLAMAGEHVRYVRRVHPHGASRTATIRWLCRRLPAGPEPLARRLASLQLASVDPDHQGDVDDPAGGEDDDFLRCARDLAVLVGELIPRLGG